MKAKAPQHEFSFIAATRYVLLFRIVTEVDELRTKHSITSSLRRQNYVAGITDDNLDRLCARSPPCSEATRHNTASISSR
jgi:hypothetical protein